jgi:hypothetical protein
MFKHFYLLLLIFCLLIPLKADFISLIKADECTNIVEMFIDDKSVRITFEIGENDFSWFKNIIPKKYYEDGFTEQNKEESFRKFYTEDFLIIADGRILKGDVKRIERTKRILRASLYSGKVDSSRANEYVIFIEVVYKFNSKPKTLTFVPPIEEGYDVTFSNIGFVTYHNKIPVHDIRYLGQAETLHLNWDDPWYSYYENKNLKRHHSSSLLSYLYIDPYEVRHEVLARIKDLEYWIDEIDYEMDDVLTLEDQEKLKSIISQYLKKQNIVTIDGKEIEPIIDKVHFVIVRLSGIQILDKVDNLDYSSAIIGVIFAYPDEGIPQEVTMKWDLFNDRTKQIPSTATDPAGPMKYILQPDDSVLVWKNFLKKYKLPTISEIRVTEATLALPFLSILILIAFVIFIIKNGKQIGSWNNKTKISGTLLIILLILTFPIKLDIDIPFMKKESFSNPEATILIDQILKNTYRAFDFRDESEIYDKLAVSSEGDLLSDIYLQTKKGMILENQGGIRVKVSDINIMNAEAVDSDKEGIAYKCLWQVKGTVGHWGHIHQRTNEYYAVLNLKPVDGVWKLHALDIIEEKRL